MFKDVNTSDIIELINYIRTNKLSQFNWAYKILLQELCRRQPYMAKVYMYRDLFDND